jgi:hypothetical protein
LQQHCNFVTGFDLQAASFHQTRHWTMLILWRKMQHSKIKSYYLLTSYLICMSNPSRGILHDDYFFDCICSCWKMVCYGTQ